MHVPSLGWEDPLEEGMTPHPSILAWKIPLTEEPVVHRVAKLDTVEAMQHVHAGDVCVLSLSGPHKFIVTAFSLPFPSQNYSLQIISLIHKKHIHGSIFEKPTFTIKYDYLNYFNLFCLRDFCNKENKAKEYISISRCQALLNEEVFCLFFDS